mgnify:CR=1 FL=1
MLETLIFLALALGLMAGGLAVWRLARGPARRRWGVAGRAAVLAVLIAPAMLFGAWKLSNAYTFQLFGGLVDSVETEAPVVALTFDDGPTAQFTAEVLEVLSQRQVKATFFVVGAALDRNPELGRQIVVGGHDLGNHSYSHTRLILRPLSFIRQEIEQTIAALEAQRAILGAAVVEPAVAALRDQLAALQKEEAAPPRQERKQVTVMFADIAGFTALSRKTANIAWQRSRPRRPMCMTSSRLWPAKATRESFRRLCCGPRPCCRTFVGS